MVLASSLLEWKLNMLNPTIPQLLRRLWQHINLRRRVQFGLLFVVVILASLAEVISIGAVLPFLGVITAPDRVMLHPLAQPFIQALSITEPEQLILPFTIAFCVGALLSGLMRFILLWGQTRLSHSIGADFTTSIYYRTLYQPYVVHVARNSSEVIAGISIKANGVVLQTLLPVLNLCGSIFMLLFIAFALFTINPMIAIIAFAGFGVIYLLVIFATKKALERASNRVDHESSQVIKALQEGLGGIREVLIDGTQSSYSNIFRNSELPLKRAHGNIIILSGFPRYFIESLGMVLIAGLAYRLAASPSGITDSIPVLGALALGAARLLPVLQQGYASLSNLRGSKSILEETLNLLNQKLPAHAEESLPSPIPFKHNITLTNLAFRYSQNTPWVLQPSLSLNIEKGSRIGFIGDTGCGKSTLLDIIMGLLQPTNGTLAIDDVSITELNQRGWQAHIAHVPQSIFLADTSIAENIAFGVSTEQIDHDRVRQAAQKAQISDTIESWGEQYNTVVGERGVQLSGGQRQRIGIARALYKEADVIVFDEATSALDNDTERAVMEAIENLGDEITVVIVAHRLTTLKNCTQIVELENGRVGRIGSYQDIIKLSANHE